MLITSGYPIRLLDFKEHPSGPYFYARIGLEEDHEMLIERAMVWTY